MSMCARSQGSLQDWWVRKRDVSKQLLSSFSFPFFIRSEDVPVFIATVNINKP